MSIDVIEICKALSNETRVNILKRLREPALHFPPQGESIGVCVSSICEKTGISQSTVSNYLDMLQRCGLLLSERRGK